MRVGLQFLALDLPMGFLANCMARPCLLLISVSHECCHSTCLQAASNLASMGVASMLLGSPPSMGPPPMHSPLRMPSGPAYLVPPAMMSPGPSPMMAASHDFAMLQMQQAAMAASMMRHGSGFDSSFGMGPAGGEMSLQLHGMQHSTPPRFGSRMGPVGYNAAPRQMSGGFRGTPPMRMSRFAPADVAAY